MLCCLYIKLLTAIACHSRRSIVKLSSVCSFVLGPVVAEGIVVAVVARVTVVAREIVVSRGTVVAKGTVVARGTGLVQLVDFYIWEDRCMQPATLPVNGEHFSTF